MGISTLISSQNKRTYWEFLNTFETGNLQAIELGVSENFSEVAEINGSHPINEAESGVGYYSDIIAPIAQSLDGFTRQNYIVLAGEYQGSEWVTSTGYFYGHFRKPMFGIPPSNKMAFLRFGEFHKMEDGKITETYVYLGLAELIIALGRWPLASSSGYEGLVPGPATHDGILIESSEPDISRASADLVEGMLKRLATEDAQWKPYWSNNMVWYGPGGLGTYSTIHAFDAFQRPFEKTFAGWGDGKEDGITGVSANCKAGDGEYAFLHGWKMITGVHVKPFLGIEPTGNRVFMRDCDWWRCSNGKIVENWCMLDTLHLAIQLGRDVISEIS
jgi:predicted ester cyclase